MHRWSRSQCHLLRILQLSIFQFPDANGCGTSQGTVKICAQKQVVCYGLRRFWAVGIWFSSILEPPGRVFCQVSRYSKDLLDFFHVLGSPSREKTFPFWYRNGYADPLCRLAFVLRYSYCSIFCSFSIFGA